VGWSLHVQAVLHRGTASVDELNTRLGGLEIVSGRGEEEIVASLQRIEPRPFNRIL
jgi:hypothetical protein